MVALSTHVLNPGHLAAASLPCFSVGPACVSRVSPPRPHQGCLCVDARGFQGGQSSEDRGYRWGQLQNQGLQEAWEPHCTPPPRRGLGRHLVGGWGRLLPWMSRPRASWMGCPGPQGGAAGGGQAGAAAGAAARPADVAEPQAGPCRRECRAGWKKALEAERPCLCWQLAEAPPAFDSPPSPPLLPLCRAQSPGSQGDAQQNTVSGVSEHLATAAKPQVRVGRRVGDTQPSDGGRAGGAAHWRCGHCPICHWLLPPGSAAPCSPQLGQDPSAHQSPGQLAVPSRLGFHSLQLSMPAGCPSVLP